MMYTQLPYEPSVYFTSHNWNSASLWYDCARQELTIKYSYRETSTPANDDSFAIATTRSEHLYCRVVVTPDKKFKLRQIAGNNHANITHVSSANLHGYMEVPDWLHNFLSECFHHYINQVIVE